MLEYRADVFKRYCFLAKDEFLGLELLAAELRTERWLPTKAPDDIAVVLNLWSFRAEPSKT